MVNEVPVAVEPADIALINILKTYYQLCRSGTDKSVLLQDPTLLQTLSTYVVEKNVKILLALTENPEHAAIFNNHSELLKNISLACEGNLPLRIVKNLMVVLSRVNNAERSGRVDKPKKSFFNKGTKQFIFSFDHPVEAQKRQMEMNCLGIRGVVSVCFQLSSKLSAKCIIRCREGVEAKTIAVKLLNAGLEVVQLHVRLENGCEETFDFYASETSECVDKTLLPEYLDDRLTTDDDLFDSKQRIVTKEQLEAEQKNGSAWFSLSSLKFW